MRVTISFTRIDGDGWHIVAQWLDVVEEYACVAHMAGEWVVPAAPGTSLDGSVLRSVMARGTTEGEAKTLGRHLFAAAVGSDRWDRVVAAKRMAKASHIALRLLWSHTDGLLGQQYWELLHDGNRYLSVSPDRVAILRVVPALPDSPPTPPVVPVRVPPRILFAVGTDMYETDIRPGAEFLGLLKELDESSRNLTDVRLLNNATVSALSRKIAEFKPHAVHIVCHGQSKDDNPTLEFRSDLPGERKVAVTAEQLFPAILSSTECRPLVVLSACDSARAPGPEMASLAATLVAHGVPAVVGMSGRVTDQTCRLFARRFGTALANGMPIALAVADGRRAAFQEGRDPPEDSVDWALPSLMVAESVDECAAVVEVPTGRTAKDRLDEDYRIQWRSDTIPTFSARFQALETFDLVLHDGGPRALLLHAKAASLGLRRLCEELTARMLRAGQVVVRVPHSEDYPQTLVQMLVHLLKSTETARRAYLPGHGSEPRRYLVESELMRAIDALLPDDRKPLPRWSEARSDYIQAGQFEAFVRALPPDELHANASTLVDALMLDLAALVTEIRQQAADDPTIARDAHLWLVLPRIDQWGDARADIWRHLIEADHRVVVAKVEEPVRVLLTRLDQGPGADEMSMRRSEFSGPQLADVEVAAFAPTEEQLAIPWVLLHPRRDMEPARGVYLAPGQADWHERYLELRSFVEDMQNKPLPPLPAFFNDPGFYRLIGKMLKDQIFTADDRLDAELLAALESEH